MAFLGYPRGHRVFIETRRLRHTRPGWPMDTLPSAFAGFFLYGRPLRANHYAVVRQLPRIHTVALVARLQQSIFPRIAHRDLADIRLEQVVQPSRLGSFFKGNQQVSAWPSDKLQNRGGLGFQDGFHHHLAGGIHHRHRDHVFVNVHADVLCTSPWEGAPFFFKGSGHPTRPALKTYP